MKLSTKSQYAIIALLDILEYGSCDNAISLSTISERQNLPLSYLEQIFLNLRKKNIVTSVRGFAGGYILNVDAALLTIYDIVMAVDALKINHPCEKLSRGICTPHGAKCLTYQLWTALDHTLLMVLKSVTLHDVIMNKVYLSTHLSPQDLTEENLSAHTMLKDCVYE